MKRITLGLNFLTGLIVTSSIWVNGSANAQTASVPTKPPALTSAPAGKKEEPEKKFFDNLRMSYSGDYDGPRFNNFDLAKTQGPTDTDSSYTTFYHTLKVGYAVSKRVTLGFQFLGIGSFDPTQGFSFADIVNYVNWGRMVDTPDIEIQGVLKVTYPSTAASVAKGKIFSIRAQGNWTFKTALRNWSFTAATKLTSNFSKNPASGTGTTDFAVEIDPYITLDVTPNIQWVFEGAFDANHNYLDTSFDFRQADPDSFDTGPMFTINSHTSVTTTLKFYTTNISFSTATPYVNLSVAL